MKKRNVFLNIIFAGVVLLLAANSFINGFNYNAVEGWKMIFLASIVTIAAFAFWYVIHNIVHELFHALGAIVFSGKVLSVSVCGLEFCFEKGRRSITYRPRSVYAGATEIVCKKPERAHLTLYFSLLGGLIGSGLTLITIALVHRLTSGFFSHYFVLMGFFPVLYMFLINFVSGGEDSDGFMLFLGKNGYKAFVRASIRLETESYLYAGAPLSLSRPEHMTELFKEDDLLDAYDYLRALEEGDISRSKEVLVNLLGADKTGDNRLIDGLIDPICEKFFIDFITKSDWNREEFDEVKDFAIFSDDINSVRIHCVYRYAIGEKDWGEKLRESYFKLCDRVWVKGLKSSYKAIGERWLEKLK